MAATWCLLGYLLGTIEGIRHGGFIEILGFQTAGMLILGPFGAVLGLFTSEARQSVMGAAIGALVGMIAGYFSGDFPLGKAVGPCLVTGGLLGATCWPWIRGIAVVAAVLTRTVRRLSR
jgi:tetrahydromethanopterin S-methyltransferase subunit C